MKGCLNYWQSTTLKDWRAEQSNNKLRQEYKKTKDNKKQTGNGRKYFDKLDEILVARPATHPPVLLETLKPATMESDSDATDAAGQDDNDNSLVDLHSQVDATTNESLSPSIMTFIALVMASSSMSPLLLLHFFPFIPALLFFTISSVSSLFP